MLATWGCTTFPKPTIDLQFAGATSLDNRITFTRASTATFFNSAGVLTSAAVDVARFDYNPSTLAPLGLLIEEQRTNIVLQSEAFNEAVWAKTNTSVTANSAASPAGTATADSIIPAAGTASKYVEQSVTTTATAFSFSVYLKANGVQFVQIRTGAAISAGFVNFDILNGTVGLATTWTGSIQAVGNGWYRVVCSMGTVSAATSFIVIQVVDSGSAARNATTTVGDGTVSVLAYGAQLEAGAFATSYIPTTTTALTRSADVATMTGTNFSSWYNAVEGTFVAQYLPSAVAASTAGQCVIHVSNGTATEQLQLIKRANVDASTRYRVDAGGVNSAFLNLGTFTATQTKAAITYKVDDFVGIKSGGSLVTDTSGGVPAPNKMDIGTELSGLSSINGYIQRIAYYPTRLADAQLQALTA